MSNAIDTLNSKCVRDLTVNIEVCENLVRNSIGIITYLTPHIGHHQGDRVGQICAATGKSVRDVCLELGLLNEEQLDTILNFDHLIKVQEELV